MKAHDAAFERMNCNPDWKVGYKRTKRVRGWPVQSVKPYHLYVGGSFHSAYATLDKLAAAHAAHSGD